MIVSYGSNPSYKGLGSLPWIIFVQITKENEVPMLLSIPPLEAIEAACGEFKPKEGKPRDLKTRQRKRGDDKLRKTRDSMVPTQGSANPYLRLTKSGRII